MDAVLRTAETSAQSVQRAWMWWLCLLLLSATCLAAEPLRIVSRWKPDEALHTERGPITAGAIRPGWHSAQWYVEPVQGERYVRLRNRHTGLYLHAEHQRLEVGEILPGWWSAQWLLQPVGEPRDPPRKRSAERAPAPSFSGESLADGQLRHGRCGGDEERRPADHGCGLGNACEALFEYLRQCERHRLEDQSGDARGVEYDDCDAQKQVAIVFGQQARRLLRFRSRLSRSPALAWHVNDFVPHERQIAEPQAKRHHSGEHER